MFVRSITFKGDFADVLTARRAWIKQRREDVPVMILYINYVKADKKNLDLKVWYVEDNIITKMIGYKKGVAHNALSFR